MDPLNDLLLRYFISEERARSLVAKHPGLTAFEIADEEGLEEAVYVETEEYGLGGTE